jgi:hypothetical protein
MTATTLDRERLAKLCGMFGSDHAGERANAAAAADRLIREAGLRWPDLIMPALALPTRAPHTAADVIELVIEHEDALTPWERDFARSVQRQRYPLSSKQTEVLKRLFEKACRAEARAA